MIKIISIHSLIGWIFMLALTSVEAKPVTAVQDFNVKKYLGQWYEIAKYPNPFQKKCISAKAFYELSDHKTLKVKNTCLRADGSLSDASGYAYLVHSDEARLKVQFFLTFLNLTWLQGDYWVIKIGLNYKYAIVSDPKRQYLWILSRTPEMEEKLYQNILNWLKEQGFSLQKIIRNKAYQF